MRNLIALSILCTAAAAAENPSAIATFESLGLYYERPAAAKACHVRYKAAGAKEWREGYPLVYDAREHQYRGSLVGLKPDTAYDIELQADTDRAEFQARTLGETFPIGKTTALPADAADKTLVIRDAGT